MEVSCFSGEVSVFPVFPEEWVYQVLSELTPGSTLVLGEEWELAQWVAPDYCLDRVMENGFLVLAIFRTFRVCLRPQSAEIVFLSGYCMLVQSVEGESV